MLYFNPNILTWFMGNDLIRLYEPFSRRNILVSVEFCLIINKIKSKRIDLGIIENMKNYLKFIEATRFNLWENMYNNPNQFDYEKIFEEIPSLEIKEIIDYLIKINFISTENVFNTNLEKSNPFERYKGNINEQIATESLFRKKSISDWWVNQKFNSEERETTKNLYKYIQDNFLDNYFTNFLKDKKVLEVGCGTGYYSKKMSNYAKSVVGIDYDKNYIDSAKKDIRNFNNLSFYIKDITDPNLFESFNKKTFDRIFMIDVFLFLFDKKFQPKLYKNKKIILSNISRLLDDKGEIIIMDPHLFWLAAREGDKENPMAIMTEYKNRKFSSIANLEQYTKLFSEAGFLIKQILEPKCQNEFSKINDFDYAFTNQFPQWIVWEIVKK